jgi:rhodanese-related sulfurtransferase
MDKDKLQKLFKKLDITVDGKRLDLEEYFKHMQKFNRQYFRELEDVDEEDDNGEDVIIKIRELEEESKEKQKELVEQNLEEFKDELAGLVADYGGTIRQLEDDQWVMIVAYLDPARGVSIDDEPSKVIVKAKKGDIDFYDFGDIEYEELKSRMVIEVE